MLENFLLEYAESKSVEKSLQTAQDIAKTEESNSPDKLQLIKKGRDLFWNFYHEEFWGNIKNEPSIFDKIFGKCSLVSPFSCIMLRIFCIFSLAFSKIISDFSIV
jgi:hypothetical protein